MSTVEDWRHVLVVTHWGFIRGLTGHEVTNAAILSYDLFTGPERHPRGVVTPGHPC
jgi:hypothetical protein